MYALRAITKVATAATRMIGMAILLRMCLTKSVTERQRYALISDSPKFAAPDHVIAREPSRHRGTSCTGEIPD